MSCAVANRTSPFATTTSSSTTCFRGSSPARRLRSRKRSPALLTRPGVVSRWPASGVRYVVWLDGSTQKTDGGGSIACGAAPGAAGCIGFGWWEKESAYEATVWDLKSGQVRGQRRHECDRHVRDHRSRGAAAVHRACAERRVRSHGRSAPQFLHRRGRGAGCDDAPRLRSQVRSDDCIQPFDRAGSDRHWSR